MTEPTRLSELANGVLTLRWNQREGIAYRLQESSDLAPPWMASSRVPVQSTNQTALPVGYRRWEVSIPFPQPPALIPPQFFRVEATR
jgi:hypothetical protein